MADMAEINKIIADLEQQISSKNCENEQLQQLAREQIEQIEQQTIKITNLISEKSLQEQVLQQQTEQIEMLSSGDKTLQQKMQQIDSYKSELDKQNTELQNQKNSLKKTISSVKQKEAFLHKKDKQLTEVGRKQKEKEQKQEDLDNLIETRAAAMVADKIETLEWEHKKETENTLKMLKNEQKLAGLDYISNATIIPLFAVIFAIGGLITNKALLTDALEVGKMLLLPFTWILSWGAGWGVTAVSSILMALAYIGAGVGVIYLIRQFLEDFGDKKTQIVFLTATAVVVFFGNFINRYPSVNVVVCYVAVLAGYAAYRIVRGR